MKKVIITSMLAIASLNAFAGSASLEVGDLDGRSGSANQSNINLIVRENVFKNFVGDVQISSTKTDVTNTISTRIEAGVTGLVPVGRLTGYVRTAVGERFGTSNFSYYSVEPGVRIPFGNLTAQVGWRYRDSFSDGNNDQTRTWRTGVSYALTKQDAIGVRFDQVRGNSNQNALAFNYTKGF